MRKIERGPADGSSVADLSGTKLRIFHGVLGLLLVPAALATSVVLLATMGGTLTLGRFQEFNWLATSAVGVLSLFLWLLSLRLIGGRALQLGRILTPREHRVAACTLAYVGTVTTYAFYPESIWKSPTALIAFGLPVFLSIRASRRAP